MNLRQRLRFLQRAMRAVAVRDSAWPHTVGGGLLFSCQDVDRSMRNPSGLRFSPLLEGVRQLTKDTGLPVHNLSHPWAVYDGHEVQGGTITMNRRLIAVRLRALADRRGGARLALEAAAYGRLLDALCPRFIFSIQPPAGLCLAVRKAGVPLAEVMHGTNLSLADPVFTAHMAQPEEQLPPTILSFDDVTHETVRALTRGRSIRAMRAADPWLIACRRQRDSRAALPGQRGRRALITLQWGYDGERKALSGIVPDGVLHPSLEQAIIAGGQRGWTFLLRMHPIQMNAPGYQRHRRRIEALVARHSNIEVMQSTAWPLPLLLEEVAAHVTMSSSAVGEAAVAGVRSLALCPTLRPGGAHDGLFHELRAQGLVDFGTLDAAGILRWLDTCSPPTARPSDDHAHTFERESAFYAALIGQTVPAPAMEISP